MIWQDIAHFIHDYTIVDIWYRNLFQILIIITKDSQINIVQHSITTLKHFLVRIYCHYEDKADYSDYGVF